MVQYNSRYDTAGINTLKSLKKFSEIGPGNSRSYFNSKPGNRRFGFSWITLLGVFIIFSSCGDNSSVGPDDNDDEFLLACAELAFTSASGTTLDEISIGKIPENFEDPVYAMVIAENSDPAYSFVFVDESQNAKIVIPIHPVTPLNGGEVSVIITDGNRTCDPVSFTIQPLPEAPGEFTAVVDAVQEILRQQMEVFGTTPQELISTPVNDLPAMLQPAALIQSIIDHPDNDQSLRAIASGEGIIGDDESLDLAERLLARINLKESLESTAKQVSGFTREPMHNDGLLLCTPDNIGTNASLLDYCMDLAKEARQSAEGAAAEVLNDLNLAFGIIGLIPNPLIEVLSNVFGAITWAIQNERERTAAMLPSFLADMLLNFSQLEFMEDDDAEGSWSAEIIAVSDGWDLGREMIEASLQAAGLIRTIEGIIGLQKVNDLLVYIGTGPVAEALLGNGTLDQFQVEPEEFGPVDITSEDWSEAEIVSGSSIELFTHNGYKPVEPGISRISIKTPDGFFGGNQIADFQDIEVTEIIVRISPDETRVQAGEIAFFTASIENAKYPELVQIDESVTMQGEPEIFYEGGGAYTVAIQAPAEPDYSTPDLLTIEHGAGTGALANRPNPNATAIVRFASIEISSNITCAQPGQEVQFSKEVLGLENEEVIWTASLGDDPVNGLYTVPEAAAGTEVTIRAESVEDADLFDETFITIGCVCSFTLQVGSNPIYIGQPGDGANYLSSDLFVPGEPYAISSVSFDNTEGYGVGFYVEIPTTVVNGPGEYPIGKVGGGLGYGGNEDFLISTNKDTGTLRIFEYEPHTKLIGELSGTARDAENQDGPPIPYFASFQIYPPPGSLGWKYKCEVTVSGND